MFKQDLEVIDALRQDAVNVHEAHPSGAKKLQAYAGQLAWISGKFPIDVCLVLYFLAHFVAVPVLTLGRATDWS